MCRYRLVGETAQASVPGTVQQGEQGTAPPATEVATPMTPATRRALATVLLQRAPRSQEEADEVLSRHGFSQRDPSRV